MDDLEQLRRTTKRLERYAVKVREKIWTDNLADALADVAEASEIARRLYLHLERYRSARTASLQDKAG